MLGDDEPDHAEVRSVTTGFPSFSVLIAGDSGPYRSLQSERMVSKTSETSWSWGLFLLASLASLSHLGLNVT